MPALWVENRISCDAEIPALPCRDYFNRPSSIWPPAEGSVPDRGITKAALPAAVGAQRRSRMMQLYQAALSVYPHFEIGYLPRLIT